MISLLCYHFLFFMAFSFIILSPQSGNCQLYGQEYPIGISVIVMPPYTPYINDYIGDPDKTIVTATNFTDSTLTVFFGGNITNNENISIYTDIDQQPFHLVTIMPNSTFRMTLNNIQEVFSADQLVYQGITEEEIIQDQNLPEGNYWICITAYDPYTKMPLSQEGQGCSNVITITVPGVALIIEPACGSNLVPMMPQNISFSWIVPENAPLNTHYTLKMNEIFAGENKNDAMAAYHPTFFETAVMTTSYQYGPADPPLVAGKNYAFTIISSDPEGNIIFENNGWSEICEFTYGTSLVWQPPDTTQHGQIVLISPMIGDTVTVYPTFEWQVLDDTLSSFIIKLWQVVPGQTMEQTVAGPIFFQGNTTATSFTYPTYAETLMDCHDYYWTVEGYTYSGQFTTQSLTWTFHYDDLYIICPGYCFCDPEMMWHKGTAIKIVRQLDYYPKKAIMEPGEAIAFSVLASDQDLLLYKCTELGSTWEKQFVIASRVNYSWEINETGPVSPITIIPAGTFIGPVAITWQPFLISFNTEKYNLPAKPLSKGEIKVVTAKCTITSSLDDAITGNVQIVLTGREDGCMDVSCTVNPVVEAGDISLSLRPGTCKPGSIPDPFTPITGKIIMGKKLCAGEISLLTASISDMDKYTLICESTQGCINPPPVDLILADPLSFSWSDGGTGVNFPLGTEGPCVAYVMPDVKEDITIQCTIQDNLEDDPDPSPPIEAKISECKVDLLIEDLVFEDDDCESWYLYLNNDNDDANTGNKEVDKDQNGEVKGEDDLLTISLSKKPEEGKVTLKVTSGKDKIKIWEKDTKVKEASETYDATELPKELYVEGIKVSEKLGDIEIILESDDCKDIITLTVIGIEDVIVHANDKETFKEESNIPANQFRYLHFVTAYKQKDVILQAIVKPDIPDLNNQVRWTTTAPGIALKSPAVGTDRRTASFSSEVPKGCKIPIDIIINGHVCKQIVAWVVSADIKCIVNTPLITPINSSGGLRIGTRIETYFLSESDLQPKEIIIDIDRPNLDGPKKTDPPPPGGRNLNGLLLSNGADLRWDVSRRYNAVLVHNAVNPPLTLGAVEANMALPANLVIGNDDAGTTDPEDNNPYNIPLGKIKGWDAPSMAHALQGGQVGDTYRFQVFMQEFIRLQLGDGASGSWFVISEPCNWQVDFRFIKVQVTERLWRDLDGDPSTNLNITETMWGRDLNGDGDLLDNVGFWDDNNSTSQ
jgi:TANFOR domain-containing protein